MDPFPEAIDMVPENAWEEITQPTILEEYSLTTQNGNTIILNDFGENIALSSPFTLSGKAPRKWFFEGIFPVSLEAPNGDNIITVWATGPWLDTVWGNPELTGEDMIPFTAEFEFSAPLWLTEWKLVLRADNPSGDEVNDDSTEVQIQFQ